MLNEREDGCWPLRAVSYVLIRQPRGCAVPSQTGHHSVCCLEVGTGQHHYVLVVSPVAVWLVVVAYLHTLQVLMYCMWSGVSYQAVWQTCSPGGWVGGGGGASLVEASHTWCQMSYNDRLAGQLLEYALDAVLLCCRWFDLTGEAAWP